MAYTIDDIRREALEKVRQYLAAIGVRPSEAEADLAWDVLKRLATEHPDWRVGTYYWRTGVREERRFCDAWEAWRVEVNGQQ